MSMFNDIVGQRKGNDGICISNSEKSRDTRRNPRRDAGRSSVLETKTSGMELFLTHLKENGTLQPLKMLERFKDTGHPVFNSISALSRGILKKKNNRDTIHFSAHASNTELLFRIIHSVNQLSIYGAVSNWCEQFGLIEEEKRQEKHNESVTRGVLTSVKSQEVKHLVSSPWLECGNSLREIFQDFESLSETIRFTRVCEGASFVHRVSAGMSNKSDLTRTTDHSIVCTFQRKTHDTESLQQFLEEQLLDQSLEFRSWKFVTNVDLKLPFHHQTIQHGHLV